MVSRCNAADGRPAARPEGAPQAARLGVTALGKGCTIACAPCLDPNHLWGSAYGFIYEGIKHCHTPDIILSFYGYMLFS